MEKSCTTCKKSIVFTNTLCSDEFCGEDYESWELAPNPGVPDIVNEPSHYTSHPSGIECIDISKHMNFCLGNAMKYIWRCDNKGKDVEDLKKAKKYLEFEIERRESA